MFNFFSFKLLIIVILSIVINDYIKLGLEINLGLSILFTIIYLLIRNKKDFVFENLNHIILILITFFLFSVSYNLFYISNQKLISQHDIFTAKVIKEPQETKNSTKLILNLINSKSKKQNVRNTKLIAYCKKEISKKIKYGDLIIFNSRINKIFSSENPYIFNYSKYLGNNDIYYQSYIDKEIYIINNDANIVFQYAIQLRNYLNNKIINSNLQLTNKQILSSLILGKKELIEPETKNYFMNSGVMHIITVSGFHVGIVFLITSFFAKLVKHKQILYKLLIIISILLIWFYAIMSGFGNSVIRASLMLSLSIFSIHILNRSNIIFHNIYLSAILILLFTPNAIYDAGFQLSYLAVWGIVYFYDKIYNLYIPNNNLMLYFWKLTSVSLAVQLVTFPITILYFHNFYILSIILNLIVVPLSFIIFIFGIILLISNFVFISSIIEKILDFLLNIFYKSIIFTTNININKISKLEINIAQTFVIYFILYFLYLFIKKKKIKYFYYIFVSFNILIISFIYKEFNAKKESKIIYITNNKESSISFLNNKNAWTYIDKNDFLKEQTIQTLNSFNINNIHIDTNKYIYNFKSKTFLIINKLNYNKIIPQKIDFIFINYKLLYKINFQFYDYNNLYINCFNEYEVLKALEFIRKKNLKNVKIRKDYINLVV